MENRIEKNMDMKWKLGLCWVVLEYIGCFIGMVENKLETTKLYLGLKGLGTINLNIFLEVKVLISRKLVLVQPPQGTLP